MSLIDLVVATKYSRQKSARLSTDEDVVRVLRKDFTALGLPHPKTDNVFRIRHPTGDWVTCYWCDFLECHSMVHLVSTRLGRLEKSQKISHSIVKVISYHTPAEHGARHRLHLPPLPREQRESIPRAVRDRSASPLRRAPQSALQSPTPSLTPVPIPSIIPTSSLIQPREPFADELVRRPARINAFEHGQKLDQTLASLRSLSATLSGTQSQGSSGAPQLNTSDPLAPPSPSSPVDSSRPPTGSSHSEIVRLTREFWENRRQITAARARLPVILEELKKFGAPGLPELQSTMESERLDVNDIAAIEATLRQEIALRTAAEARLAEEQARRTTAELAISDVERECRAPFIVPALMRAFLDISKLSDEAITKPPLS